MQQVIGGIEVRIGCIRIGEAAGRTAIKGGKKVAKRLKPKAINSEIDTGEGVYVSKVVDIRIIGL